MSLGLGFQRRYVVKQFVGEVFGVCSAGVVVKEVAAA
jgi:hypothetical protein